MMQISNFRTKFNWADGLVADVLQVSQGLRDLPLLNLWFGSDLSERKRLRGGRRRSLLVGGETSLFTSQLFWWGDQYLLVRE